MSNFRKLPVASSLTQRLLTSSNRTKLLRHMPQQWICPRLPNTSTMPTLLNLEPLPPPQRRKKNRALPMNPQYQKSFSKLAPILPTQGLVATTHHAPSFPALLAGANTPESWLVWTKKMPTLATKPNPNVVC